MLGFGITFSEHPIGARIIYIAIEVIDAIERAPLQCIFNRGVIIQKQRGSNSLASFHLTFCGLYICQNVKNIMPSQIKKWKNACHWRSAQKKPKGRLTEGEYVSSFNLLL